MSFHLGDNSGKPGIFGFIPHAMARNVAGKMNQQANGGQA